MAMKSGDKDAIIKELDNQFDVHNAVQRRATTRTRRSSKCANDTAELLAETGDGWHLEAVGSGGVRGTGDQKTMDLAALPLQEGRRQLQSGRLREVRVPAHRQGRLADDLQDQVRDGRPALLPAEVGGVRSGVRRRRRRGPERARGRRSRVRRGALLPEHLRPRRTRAARTRRAAATCPGAGREGARGEEGRGDKFKPKDVHRHAEGHDPGLQPVRLLHQAADRTTRTARSSYVEVKYARARTYFEAQHWEEAALAFRDVAHQPPRQRRRRSTRRSSTSSRSTCSASTPSRRSRRASTTWRRTSRVPRALLQGRARRRRTRSSATSLDESSATSSASRRRGARRSTADKGGNDALEHYEKGGDAYFELWQQVRRGAAARRTSRRSASKLDEIALQRGAGLPGGAPRREGDPRRA